MASDPGNSHPRGRLRCALALLLFLAGCKLIIPELFEGDDCSPWNDRPIDARFETSEGPISFDHGQILLAAAADAEDCYTGISLSFLVGEDSNASPCWMRIGASATASGIGDEWPIDVLYFGAAEECPRAPATIRDVYQWDRSSVGGYVKVVRPDALAVEREQGCLRDGIEIHLNARMIPSSTLEDPNAVKEFWFPEQTYFIDEPLPVVEAFDCPF